MTYSVAPAPLNTVHPRGPVIQATPRSESKRKVPNPKRVRRTLKGSDRNLIGEMYSAGKNYLPPLPGSEMPSLSLKQAREVAQLRASERAADTQAAIATPSQPTPKYLKALAKSEAIKATQRAEKARKQQLRNT